MLVFSFGFCILLRGFNTCTLTNNPFRRKEIRHVKFTSIIRSQTLNFEIKLGLNQWKERSDKRIGLRLMLHKKTPSKSTKIIDYSEKESRIIWIWCGKMTPNITMNDVKYMCCSSIVSIRKRNVMLFS